MTRSGTPSTRLNGSSMWIVTCCEPRPSEAAARCISVAALASASVRWLWWRPKVSAPWTVPHWRRRPCARHAGPGPLPLLLRVVAFDLVGRVSQRALAHLLHPEDEIGIDVP